MKPIIIEKDFEQLLTEVQEAFAKREKGPMGIGHKQGSGEKAIAEYFKTLGIEIDVKDEFLVDIASKQKEVTADDLKDLLLNVNALTHEERLARKEEIDSLMNVDVVSGSTQKTHEERLAARLEPNSMNTVALYNKQTQDQIAKRSTAGVTILESGVPIALTQDGDFDKAAAQNLIIDAYNKCVGEKSMAESDFVKTLFGESFTITTELADLMKKSKEVFKALHSQYGNYKIEDNLAKVENNLTTWEKIKDFISKILSFVVDMGTNAGDKEKYKANKMEPKSLLKHAAKNPSGQQIT